MDEFTEQAGTDPVPAGADGKFAVEPSKGKVCAALYNDGRKAVFCRARIEAVAGSKEEPENQSCLVTFIDYGNQAEVRPSEHLHPPTLPYLPAARRRLCDSLPRLALLPPLGASSDHTSFCAATCVGASVTHAASESGERDRGAGGARMLLGLHRRTRPAFVRPTATSVRLLAAAARSCSLVVRSLPQ